MKIPRVLRRAVVRSDQGAFTLIELLVSLTVVAFIVVMVTNLSSSTMQIWSGGERAVENNQTGRAVLEIVARELSQAVVSSKLPFVQDPVLPSDANQRPSNSIFWVAPLSSTNGGDLCEVGYYLTSTFELKRFFVPPSDAANYKVLTAMPTNNNYALRPTGSSGNDNDHTKAARWASEFVTAKDANGRSVSNTVASGVLNFFVRCLDINGDPIPWLDTGLKYNSAEPMRPATPGVRNSTAVNGSNPSSFTYTYFNANNVASDTNAGDAQNTACAHLLPYAVELTLVTTDPKSLQRLGAAAVPSNPALGGTYSQRAGYPPGVLPTAPLSVPGNVALFMQQAQAAGFRDARCFSTTVRLRNAAQ